MASAGPYANLHFATDRTMLASHHSVFLQAGFPSCRPTNNAKTFYSVDFNNHTDDGVEWPVWTQMCFILCIVWQISCVMSQQKHIDEVIDASSKFSKATEEKLIQKMETSLKNREDQLKQLMDRLKDHVIFFYLLSV